MMLMEKEEASVSDPMTGPTKAAPSPARAVGAAVNLYKHRQAIVDSITRQPVIKKQKEIHKTEKFEKTGIEIE